MSFDYTEIIDFLPDATFVIDSRGVVVAWNRSIEKMTGVTAATIVGKGDFVYAIPFYGKKRPILIDLVENRNPQLRKHYNVKKIDNKTLHAEAFVASAYGGKGAYLSGLAAPLYDRDGNYVGAVESIRDISDQKQVEETLRQRTNLLEETYEVIEAIDEGNLVSLEEELGDQIKVSSHQAFLDFQTGQKKVEVYDKIVRQADENYQDVHKKFENRIATTTDLLEADVQLLQARINREIAASELFVTYCNYLKVSGDFDQIRTF